MVFKMNEISDYFNEQLDIAKGELQAIQDKIHADSLDIEFIEKACNEISSSKDDTNDIFFFANNENVFENKEIKKLKKQKEERLQSKAKLEHELAEKKACCERLKHLFEISLKMSEKADNCGKLSIREADRQRIAMDIHDTVIQNLTALILKNEFVIKIMSNDFQRAQLELKNINELLKSNINELRDIVFNIRPMSIDDLGFETAFQNLMGKLADRTQMFVEYDYRAGDLSDIDSVILINILRMIQELYNNAIKHSKGTYIYAQIEMHGENIEVIVEDDGIGFDYKEISQKQDKNFGLSMIHERITLLDGNFELCNRESEGTKCTITVPVKRGNDSCGKYL